MKKKKTKTKPKSAKKQKYAAFSKVDDSTKIKTPEVSKEDRAEAERSLNYALRGFVKLIQSKGRKTCRRFCKVCQKRIIHNTTNDFGLVCSRCGNKEGGDSKVYWKEKLG